MEQAQLIEIVKSIIFTIGKFALINAGIVQILKSIKFHTAAIPYISMGTGVLTVYAFTGGIDGPGIAMGLLVGLASSGGYVAFAKLRDAFNEFRGVSTGTK